MVRPIALAIRFASMAEKEVERLLRAFLPGTPFAGKVKAVGGYVRDQMLNDPNIDPNDLDILVDMVGGAEKVTHYLHEHLVNPDGSSPVSTPHPMGKGYPIWEIIFKNNVILNGETYGTAGAKIQFAEPMKESYPDPSSRQRVVEPATIHEDIARRDFTVNMLLKDMATGEIEDLSGVSKEDLKRGVLKGHPQIDPDKMFSDDPLRMIRLIRFQTKYGWKIPRFMLDSVKRNAERITIVSAERIMTELEKIMDMGKLERAIRLMSLTGLLKHVLPEVEQLKGVAQNAKYHEEGDVYRHTLMVLKNAPPGVENQIAALLHDIGKPATSEMLEGEIKTYGHDDVGADIAEAILKRLHFKNETIDRVKTMVKNHMRPHFLGSREDVTPKSLRKFIREVGEELVDSVLALARADELGAIPDKNRVPDLVKKIEEIRKHTPDVKKPILNGREIMELLKIPQGSAVGQASKIVTEIADEYADAGKELTKEEAQKELLKRFKLSCMISLPSILRSIAGAFK